MTAPATAPDTRPYSPGLEGVVAGETRPRPRRRRERPAALPRLPHRRPRRARDLSGGREPALDRRVGPGGAPAHGGRAGRGAHRPARAAGPDAKPMDALRTAVSVWGATTTLDVAADASTQARALTAFSPSALAAFARHPARARSRSTPTRRSTSCAGFLYQLNGERAGRGDGPGARRVLHRRRRARASTPRRSRPGDHLDAVRPRVGGRAARSAR